MSSRFCEPARVFISYAQFSDAHSAQVLALAQSLRRHGLDVEIDQYHKAELLDWPRWCREQLQPDRSDWVLMVCTATYRDRLENRVDPHTGRGVFWEGALVDDEIYEAKGNHRFVPILLDDESENSVPGIVRGWTSFRIRGLDHGDPGYATLYRLLTGQPLIEKAPIGALVSDKPLMELHDQTVSSGGAGCERHQAGAPFSTTTASAKTASSPREILRESLCASFTDRVDVINFCADNCDDVYKESRGMTFSQILTEIIVYYEARGRERELWQWIRGRNPSNYQKWFGQWEAVTRLD